jgi:NifB/MoaA-like Fe-S oxidoreductase
MVFAADEYHLLADRPFPSADEYEGFSMHEDGIGMARTFEREFHGVMDEAGQHGVRAGFFAAVDGAPADGYRAVRHPLGRGTGSVVLAARRDAPIGILTGSYGARVLEPLVASLGRDDVRIVEVRNEFFGGNTAVTGLITGSDLTRVLRDEPPRHRYLLPDVCLSEGRFLDGTTVDELPRSVEVVPTDGRALRASLTSHVERVPS